MKINFKKEYLNRFSQNNDSVFNFEDIKPIDYKELDGKILKVVVAENEDVRIIAGQDLDTKKIYVLSCENFKLERNN